ncbi:MAG: hypothetical protein NUV91_06870 [Candidatus Omnitrophica bacterium]|nr:hypothetical protein [Candidatus Omnitrophota bacterium]
MRLTRIIPWMGSVALLALIYTHLQMEIFDLAYQAKQKENDIVLLRERNNIILSDISRLKSANNLGASFLVSQKDLRFRDSKEVVEIVAVGGASNSQMSLASAKTTRSNLLWSLFTPKSQAEARTIEKRNIFSLWKR